MDSANAKRAGAEFKSMGDDVLKAVIQEGLDSDPKTESHWLARKLQAKLDAGKTISDRELGRLYQANVRAVQLETEAEARDEQAQEQGAPEEMPDSLTQEQLAAAYRQLQEATDVFGKSGAKALIAAYDRRGETGQYFGGFAAYYQAGLTGAGEGSVKAQYARRLTQAQRYAAYTAGQNDAAESLERERRGAAGSQMAGKDSAARTRLLHIARRLQNKKLSEVNRTLLNQYIGELDTMAKSMTGTTLARLSALREWYEDQRANNPDFISDLVIRGRPETAVPEADQLPVRRGCGCPDPDAAGH